MASTQAWRDGLINVWTIRWKNRLTLGMLSLGIFTESIVRYSVGRSGILTGIALLDSENFDLILIQKVPGINMMKADIQKFLYKKVDYGR